MPVDIDAFMADWRDKFYGQHGPLKLRKLDKNIAELKSVLSPTDTLLDVGCNLGAVYGVLNHENYEGIDLDVDAIAKARSTYPGVNFRVGDLFDLEGKWDVVLVSRVLMHVAPLGKAMERLLGAARRKCVLFVPVAEEDSCQLESLHDGSRAYFRRFSEQTMRSFGECVIVRREPYSTVIYG